MVIAAFVEVGIMTIESNFDGVDVHPVIVLEGLLNLSLTKRTFIFI